MKNLKTMYIHVYIFKYTCMLSISLSLSPSLFNSLYIYIYLDIITKYHVGQNLSKYTKIGINVCIRLLRN